LRRKYKYRVGVYEHIAVADGFGGNTLTESLLGNSWADVESVSSSSVVAYGLDINKQTVRFKMRYRDDIDYTDRGLVLKYKSKNWQPLSVVNVDVFDRHVEILAINVTIDNMPEITYVPVDSGDGPKLIDGFTVTKADGNTLTSSIEGGDFIYGFFGDVFAAGTVTTIPVNDITDINVAVKGEPI